MPEISEDYGIVWKNAWIVDSRQYLKAKSEIFLKLL